jgi:hypothetical protein
MTDWLRGFTPKKKKKILGIFYPRKWIFFFVETRTGITEFRGFADSSAARFFTMYSYMYNSGPNITYFDTHFTKSTLFQIVHHSLLSNPVHPKLFCPQYIFAIFSHNERHQQHTLEIVQDFSRFTSTSSQVNYPSMLLFECSLTIITDIFS